MTYITWTESYGRKERKIDLDRFAEDLARELGCELAARADEELDRWRRYINVGSDRLMVSANDWKGRVNVSIAAPEIGHDDRDLYNKDHKTESATVNPDGRSIAAIAKDIKRRVIAASQGALAAQREYAAKQKANRAGLAETVAKMKEAMPYLDIRYNEREQRASIYDGGGDAQLNYLSAELGYDRTIQIRGLSNLSVEQFTRAIETIRGEQR